MSKEIIMGIILGIVPAIIIFLLILEVNITPLVLAVLLIGILIYYLYSRGYLKNSFFDSNSYNINDTSINFDKIGGQHRAKREITEALDFIIKADEYQKHGIRPLKGLLLIGPPGTGKTMLAKAAANYTNSIFLAANGSEFVEMYVGMGAKRIRDIFGKAYKQASKENKKSSIIFIDEIDVIGQKRSDNTNNKEYDQTLNQLLTEMDGIKESNEIRILVIAATNRPDTLDHALLRPGRFDRKILVDLPDKEGRSQIIKIHIENKNVSFDITVDYIVNKTFGFSGAELEKLLNEASILALRENSDYIKKTHINEAIDKVLIGEKADRKASIDEIQRVAYHELGHAIISEIVNPGSVDNISIIPRGGALGYVRQSDEEDRYLYTREMFEKQIMIALAGSVTENEFLGNKSTGAKNDFMKAIDLAKNIVKSGISELGVIDEQLNKDEYSKEVNSIIQALENTTINIIKDNKNIISDLYDILIKHETIDGDNFRKIIKEF